MDMSNHQASTTTEPQLARRMATVPPATHGHCLPRPARLRLPVCAASVPLSLVAIGEQ
jgi:hypothetical protein